MERAFVAHCGRYQASRHERVAGGHRRHPLQPNDMKRKGGHTLAEPSRKCLKLDGDSELHSASPLLRVYYSHVATLRHYLASKLSKNGRKRILQYGVCQPGMDVADTPDPAMAALLDSVLVGAFSRPNNTHYEGIDKDITIYTQRFSESTAEIGLTQSALKQSEVGQSESFRSDFESKISSNSSPSAALTGRSGLDR